jgi:hypothetical protein
MGKHTNRPLFLSKGLASPPPSKLALAASRSRDKALSFPAEGHPFNCSLRSLLDSHGGESPAGDPVREPVGIYPSSSTRIFEKSPYARNMSLIFASRARRLPFRLSSSTMTKTLSK